MYFNYYTYYENENENETYTDKQLKKEIFKKNKEFYKTDIFKSPFLSWFVVIFFLNFFFITN